MAIVSILQMASGGDVQKNMDMACEGIQKAALGGAQLVALPEEFATLGLSADAKRAIAEKAGDGPMQAQLSQCAADNKIWIVGGALPIQAPNHKITSSCFVFDAEGKGQCRYDKVHLFDVQISENEAYQESLLVEAGHATKVIDTPVGRIGLAICYDVRFPEQFRLLMQQGVEIIIVPSAFTIPTGEAHWEVLLRARAIENLCYVLAPAECGLRQNGKGTYGHSLMIGPWGEILQQAGMEPALLTAEIDLARLHQIRSTFPAIEHARFHSSIESHN